MTDSLTDLDIFKDLQEACTTRKVPVYILLDQSGAPAFLKMCSNIKVQLEELRVSGHGCNVLYIMYISRNHENQPIQHILLVSIITTSDYFLICIISSLSSKQMRVRTITGGTYFMRSGAKITGKVHERFMLIDGNRVATGSYR